MEKTARVYYLLSEAGRKASLLSGGDGKELQCLTTEATPEIIELASVGKNGEIVLNICCLPNERSSWMQPIQACEWCKGYDDEWKLQDKRGQKYFDAPQDIEALITAERDRQAMIQAVMAEKETREAENEIVRARREAAHLEKKRRDDIEAEKRIQDRLVREAREAEAKAAYEAERAAWIEEHGSDYLKTGLRLGYNINRTYVDERAAIEHPGYVVARGNKWQWKKRINPNPETLTEVAGMVEAGLDAEIVWLIDTPYAYDDSQGYYEPFDSCEAIVIHNYLGHYDLIKF